MASGEFALEPVAARFPFCIREMGQAHALFGTAAGLTLAHRDSLISAGVLQAGPPRKAYMKSL